MHLYVLARAEKDRLEKWKSDLSGQLYPIKYIDPNTKEVVDGHGQVAVRHVELLEIVVPKEQEAWLMGMIQPGYFGGKAIDKSIPFLAQFAGRLNKPLEREKWIPNKNLFNTWVHCIALGTKEDKIISLIKGDIKTEERI